MNSTYAVHIQWQMDFLKFHIASLNKMMILTCNPLTDDFDWSGLAVRQGLSIDNVWSRAGILSRSCSVHIGKG